MTHNVKIGQKGFIPQNLSLEEGQSVLFEWNEKTYENITQIVHNGQTFVAVLGGYDLQMPPDRSLVLPFNLEGEYTFTLNGTVGQILTITVHPRQEYTIEVTNDGFQEDIIRISKGTSIKWYWKQCAVRHTVHEVLYCVRHAKFYTKSQIPQMGTLTGSHRQQFKKPGVYYFRTESSDVNKLHYCAVVVSEMNREYKINVLDNMFQPSILVIEEGEIVWWHWSQDLCENSHAVFQIEPPALNSSLYQPYEPVKDGFMWLEPSSQGLMAQTFTKPGVYYYSDQDKQFSADIIGTIIVKSKPKDHHVKVNNQTGFICDLLRLETNDRIWWNWIDKDNKISSFNELDRYINPVVKQPLLCCIDKTDEMDEESKEILSKVGLICVCITTIGVYTYTVTCIQDIVSTCTVIAKPAPKNHTIHITEDGYEKHAITIRPHDYVWWVWQNEKLPHNIVQVTYSYEPVQGGFNSGTVRESPSAFMHQFHTPGTYYYQSFPIKKIGVIQVTTQTQVQEVSVNIGDIRPDPIVINVNDIICWVFKVPKLYDLQEVDFLKRVKSFETKDEELVKRRCIAKVLEKPGLFHFTSKSFLKQKGNNENETVLSTVIVDPVNDSTVVYVDNMGFHPQSVVLEKGQQVVWKWTEPHNIVHVTYSSEAETSGIVSGKRSFNSGKAISNSQFCHNFYDPGEHTVISERALDYYGSVTVIENAPKLQMAYFIDDFTDKELCSGDKIKLAHPLSNKADYNLKLYYTLDGTYPHPYNKSTMVYDDECGIVFLQGGIHVIRVIAQCKGFQNSDVLNSQRFYSSPTVSPDVRPTASRARSVDYVTEDGPKEILWKWWSCEPCIRLEPLGSGKILLTWNRLTSQLAELVSGYKLFLNNVNYSNLILPNFNSLQVKGLAAGQKYSIHLKVIARSVDLKPIESNTIVYNCPCCTSKNGPLISLEVGSNDNCLAIRWAPIKDPEIAYYQVYQNNVKCISKIPHLNNGKPMNVVLKQSEPNVLASIYVEAIPRIKQCEDTDDSVKPITSNVLDIKMTDVIKYLERLSPIERMNTSEPFLEYITVKENSVMTNSSQSSEFTSSTMSSNNDSDTLSISESSSTETSPNEDTLNEQLKTVLNPTQDSSGTTKDSSENGNIPKENSQTENRNIPKENSQEGNGNIPKENSQDGNGNIPKENSQDGNGNIPKENSQSSLETRTHIKEASSVKEVSSVVETSTVKQVSLSPVKEVSSVAEVSSATETVKEVSTVSLVLQIEDHYQDNAVVLRWEESSTPLPNYEAKIFSVSVSGTSFLTNINSNLSYECNIDRDDTTIRGTLHCWDVTKEKTCRIIGLCPGLTYNFSVKGTYSSGDENLSIKSSEKVYSLKGPPGPPSLTSFKVDLYTVSFCIEEPKELHPDLKLAGFKVFYDSQCDEQLINTPDTRIEKEIKPGSTVTITAVAVPDQNIENSKQCSPVHVSCPVSPLAPAIEEQTSFKSGCIIIGWSKPPTSSDQDISMYRIYLNDKLNGEIQANSYSDKNGYQFTLTELAANRNYKVYVKSVCGQSHIEPGSKHIFVLSDSLPSNTLTVCSSKTSGSPKLYLESMTPDGIDVAWEVPEQKSVVITGYQMFKNRLLYGSVIPPEINSLRIRDLTLGNEITLQLVALTKPPPNEDLSMQDVNEEASEKINKEKKDSAENLNYFCEPGEKLNLHYTGLVQCPTKVWCEKVTGHSALIVWNKNEELKAHYVQPEKYQLTWWPGEQAEKGIGTDCTEEDHFVLTNLQSNTIYTVVVEARSMKKIRNENTDNGEERIFILSTKSEKINLKTASPPNPPSNIGVVSSTCNSVKLAWTSPREHGVEITGLYLELTPITNNADNVTESEHQTLQLRPDSKEVVFKNLSEKSEYLFRIFALNDEYFDLLPRNHRLKKLRYIPEGTSMNLIESMWLPYSSFVFRTSGTDPATNLTVSHCTTTSITVNWTNAVVHGTNQIQRIVVRWVGVEEKASNNKELSISQLAKLPKDANFFVIKDLVPGYQYCITVETIVNLKTSLDADNCDNKWRTVCVSSQPLVASTQISIPTPKIYVSSYKGPIVNLFWEAPRMTSIVGKDKNGKELYQKCYLLGYQLIINDSLHATLRPEDTLCTLQKCKPGKNYSVILIVMSSYQNTNIVKKWKCHPKNPPNKCWPLITSQNNGIDYTASEPLNIKLPSKSKASITSARAIFQENEDTNSQGDFLVEWSVSSHEAIKEFSVKWFLHNDKVTITKSLIVNKLHCCIPVNRLKSIYEITIESHSREGEPETSAQAIHAISPGEPDPPLITLDSASSSVICLCWQQPRTYGDVPITAYQLYVNGEPTVELDSDTTSYNYSCLAERVYKFNLVALSSNWQYGDSAKSNTLVVMTAATNGWRNGRHQLMFPGESKNDPNYLKASKVTDTKIHLEWNSYMAPEGLQSYKIQWSSVAQPEAREVCLLASDKSCIINKCLSGVIHYLRLISIGPNDTILDESHYLTIQTSAPPNMPVVILRACNFQYISIEWNRPLEYGEAKINGYLVFINNILEANLPDDQTAYTFTEGEWCKEYSFQVQALTNFEWLSSKISDPQTVQWPGVVAPILRRDPPFGPDLIVSWDKPVITAGIKIKYFKITCSDCSSGDAITTHGPILPGVQSLTIDDLDLGCYLITLKIHIYHTNKIICSEPIEVTLFAAILPPTIKVNIIGLQERQLLEKTTCQLLNARDKLISSFNNKQKVNRNSLTPTRKSNSRNSQEVLAIKTSLKLENLLEKYIIALSNYTGQALLDISWECTPSNPNIQATGYQLLLDGQNFGTLIPEPSRNFKTMLKVDDSSHTLSMIAQYEDTELSSQESNAIQIETAQFLPFTYYCYCKGHIKEAKWPTVGCCQFVDALSQEQQLCKKLSNPGVMKQSFQLPDCLLKNQTNNSFEPVFPIQGATCPTLVLFWIPWCHPCKKVMNFLVTFVREHPNLFSYLCINCDTQCKAGDSSHLTSLENDWNKEPAIKHYSSHMILGNKHPDDECTETKDLRQYLGIEGLPSILLTDNMGFILWHGRFCAPNYKLFSSFLLHALHQVNSSNRKNCIHCEMERSQDSDIEFIQQLLRESDALLEKIIHCKQVLSGSKLKKMLFKRPNSSQSYYSFEKDLNFQEDQLIDLNNSRDNEQQ
ncbi:uncharacterized protein LOC115211041 isoform X2 [Octopus sinensis]|uniref:Uncharacterized protein LOC115211041 isoform X2 n=1 Tax=Octopus sinensis TaxID=2607531 RepID=A0A7E6ER16_9MOLL|nr:uncharacterized protein LOC115211041 isoform X2 [Octopus sinensis]